MSGFSGDDPAGTSGIPPLVASWKAGQTFYGYDEFGKACRFPRPPPMQRVVVTTLAIDGVGVNAGIKAGQAKWVFPNPYAAGIKPVITISVEQPAGSAPDVKAIEVTNTYVIIEVTKSLVNLGILNINGVASATVHLTANIPTPTVTMP